MSDTLEGLDARGPPPLTPERVSRTRLAWWTMLVASHSTRRCTRSSVCRSTSTAIATELRLTRVSAGDAMPARATLDSPGMRGVDMHVHLPTGDWVCGCVGHYLDSVERYFGRRPEPHSVEELVALYERLDLVGVLLGWDAQGREIDNAELAAICAAAGGRFVGFGSVGPNREDAIERLGGFPQPGPPRPKVPPAPAAVGPG